MYVYGICMYEWGVCSETAGQQASLLSLLPLAIPCSPLLSLAEPCSPCYSLLRANSSEILRNFPKSSEIFRNFPRFSEILRNSPKFDYAEPCYSLLSLAIVCHPLPSYARPKAGGLARRCGAAHDGQASPSSSFAFFCFNLLPYAPHLHLHTFICML